MIYLHHYPASLFSEKIRALLGHYKLAWRSVEIAPIMPRPLLMPLSGGYRRTPVLQIDANVYADTRIICLALARHVGDDDLYGPGFVAHRVADWADTHLFRIGVALNFRPEALGAMMGNFTPQEAEAFAVDRAQLSGNQPLVALSAPAALAELTRALSELDAALAVQANLCGETPCIADFSVYHNLWFLGNNPVNARLLEPYEHVGRWMAALAAAGHGDVEVSSGEAALAAAREATPELPAFSHPRVDTPAPGTPVEVTPVDYGCIPVRGTLVAQTTQEVVIERTHADCGTVYNHFPQAGFEVNPVEESS